MSTKETTNAAETRYVPAGDIARYVGVLDKALGVSDAHNLESQSDIIENELLAETGMDWDTLKRAQKIGADVSAALMYVGSKKAIAHCTTHRDVSRVAGKMQFGNNELAYSFQSMAKESNADGSPKNPVVSVIHRQYEAEEYREIRKDVMVSSLSLRD